MTRFQKLALLTAIATYVLVVWGGVVRVTGSGLGCPDWPLCYGQVLPPADDATAWIEWFHRTLAAVVGLLVVGVWLGAVLYHRRRAIVLPATAAVVFTGFQAYLGKITVETGNSGESVTAHLAMAMIVLAALIHIAVRVQYPADLPSRGAPQRFTILAAFAALSIYALLIFGRTSRRPRRRSSSAPPGRSSPTAPSCPASTATRTSPRCRPPTRSIASRRPSSASSSPSPPGSPGAEPPMVAGGPSALDRRCSP